MKKSAASAQADAPNIAPVIKTNCKTERSHEENQERAYIAASRRMDRSLEARVQSARMASEIHKKRTGCGLRINEEIVLNEEMYEEENDRTPHSCRLLDAHMQTSSASLNSKLESVASNKLAMTNLLVKANDEWRENEINTQFEEIFGKISSTMPYQQQQQDEQQTAVPATGFNTLSTAVSAPQHALMELLNTDRPISPELEISTQSIMDTQQQGHLRSFSISGMSSLPEDDKPRRPRSMSISQLNTGIQYDPPFDLNPGQRSALTQDTPPEVHLIMQQAVVDLENGVPLKERTMRNAINAGHIASQASKLNTLPVAETPIIPHPIIQEDASATLMGDPLRSFIDDSVWYPELQGTK